MHAKNRLKVLLLGVILSFALVVSSPSKAFAASAAFTTESSSSVTAGATTQVSVYVTPSGIVTSPGDNLWGAQVTVSFTNFTYVSFNTSASPFSFNEIMSSNSNSFTVGAAYTTGTGSTSKVLLGVATVQAGSAASGQIQLSGAVAGDYNENPMSTSTQGARTVSFTCPSGQTGTPPSCTAPSGGGGSGNNGGTGGTGSTGTGSTSNSTNTTKTNPVDNPNPDSTANIGSDEQGNPITVSENDASLISSGLQPESQASDKVATITETSVFKRSITIAAIVALIAGVLVVSKIVLAKVTAAKAFSYHGSAGASTQPVDTPTSESDQDNDHTPKTPTGSGPTIIHPQQ